MDETGSGAKKKRELPKTPEQPRQQTSTPSPDDIGGGHKNSEDQDLKRMSSVHVGINDDL